MSTLNHLADDIRPLVELPVEERARLMICDRFISHDALKPILEHIDYLRFAPPLSRASGLCVYGKPGAGKTMLAQSILRRYSESSATETTAATQSVIMINMTGAKEAKHLYNRLLASLNCPAAVSHTGADRERLALNLCRAAGVRLVIVDEIQDILTSTPRQQRIALDTIKFLMNELSISILALGVEKAKNALEVDEHLNARFQYRQLPLWKADATLGKFLDTLEMRLPLKQRSCLSAPTMMRALVTLSGGSLAKIVEIICVAAALAVEQGTERITVALMNKALVEKPKSLMKRPMKPAGDEDSSAVVANPLSPAA